MKTLLASVLALLLTTASTGAATVAVHQSKDSTLLATLRHGGCVILMRQARSADARTMGDALRQMEIPIGEVMSSPVLRAREAIGAAGLRAPRTYAQLGDTGHGMRQGEWLRQMVSRQPSAGSNTLIVTQMPNIRAAYGRPAAALQPGGAMIFQPDGRGDARMLAVMQIGDWQQLAAQFKR